nr:hypothetical protein [Stenotrophomonas maltophilia]
MPDSTMRTPRLRRQHHPSSAATGTAGNSTKNSPGSTCRGSSSVAETNPAAITAVTSNGLPQAGNVGQFGLGIAALAASALRRRSRRLPLNSASVLVASRRGGDRHRPARNPTSNVRATTESPVRQSAGNRLRADESSSGGSGSPSISATSTLLPSSMPWSRFPSRRRGTMALSMMRAA